MDEKLYIQGERGGNVPNFVQPMKNYPIRDVYEENCPCPQHPDVYAALQGPAGTTPINNLRYTSCIFLYVHKLVHLPVESMTVFFSTIIQLIYCYSIALHYEQINLLVST